MPSFSPWSPHPTGAVLPASALVGALVTRPGHVLAAVASEDWGIFTMIFDDAAMGSGWAPPLRIAQFPAPTEPLAQPELVPDQPLSGPPPAGPPPINLVLPVPAFDGTVDLFVVWVDGHVYTTRVRIGEPPQTWRAITDAPHLAPGTRISAVAPGPSLLRLYGAGGLTGQVFTGARSGLGRWGAWESISDEGMIVPFTQQRIAAVAGEGGRTDLFVTSATGQVMTCHLVEGGERSAWTAVGDAGPFSPTGLVTAIALREGILLLVPAIDGGVLATVRAGTPGREAWTRIGEEGLLSPFAVASVTPIIEADGAVRLFAVARDGSVVETRGGVEAGAPRFEPWSKVSGLEARLPAEGVVAAVSCREGRADLLAIDRAGQLCTAFRQGPRPALADEGRAPGSSHDGPVVSAAAAQKSAADAVAARRRANPITRRTALLVGVNRYVDPQIPPLPYCKNDVLALRDALLASGFAAVTVLADDAAEERLLPTRENIKVALLSITDALREDELLLVHFSCHGALFGGLPHLLPSNTRLAIPEETALSVEELNRLVMRGRGRAAVVLLDACHTGTDGRALPVPGLSADFVRHVYDQATGLRVLAAAGAQQVARERTDVQRGIFTAYVLEALERVDGFARADRGKAGFVSFDALKDYVCAAVATYTNATGLRTQTPEQLEKGAGDVVVVDYRGG